MSLGDILAVFSLVVQFYFATVKVNQKANTDTFAVMTVLQHAWIINLHIISKVLGVWHCCSDFTSNSSTQGGIQASGKGSWLYAHTQYYPFVCRQEDRPKFTYGIK